MPTNEELARRRLAAVPRGVANSLQVYADRARNAQLWDVEGRRYIDFASGIAVLNTGHLHPQVQAAIEAQLQRFSHTCFQVTPYESYVELAERLNTLAPGPGPHKTLFLSTGAEAVENAIKIARCHTGRNAVIAFGGGFHGRTLAAMALTGKVQPYKAGFGTLLPDVFHAPFPASYHGVTGTLALEAIERIFKYDVERSASRPSSSSPCRAKAGSTSRRRIFCAACANSATDTASCSCATKSRAVLRAPGACSRTSTPASSPT